MRDIAVKLLEEVETNKLPSLPHVLVKLLQACREEIVCFDTLSDLIGQDASLSARVIKAANSPVYGRARNLNSLKHTLLFLGLDTIKSITITASIKQFFSEYSAQKTSFLKDFWQHSLSCANIARGLAELTSYPYVEEAYLSGLLHDIGKLLLEPKMDASYKKLDHGGLNSNEILQSEKQQFGMNHTELAALLLEKWHLPDVVCDAVRYHHAPLDDIQQAHHLARIINLANLLTTDNHQQHNPTRLEAAIKLFDLSESIVNKLVTQANDKTRDIAASMEIDIGESEGSQAKDELKQIELAQEVRDNALVLAGQIGIHPHHDNLFQSIQQSMALLFGFSHCLVLGLDSSQQYLQAIPSQQLPESQLLADLKIDMQADNLLTRSLNNQKILDSFTAEADANTSILDQQIARGLKTSGFISIPVIKSSNKYAVLIVGCEQGDALKAMENQAFLRMYADNIADHIIGHQEYIRHIEEVSQSHQEEFLQRARQIVHETNNPLSVIRNYLQLLSGKLDSSSPVQGELETIRQEIDRISNIILRCKDKPDDESFESTSIDLNQLIAELIDVYKASLFATHSIQSTLNLDKHLSRVKTDRDIVKQIITNLVKNSVEAIVNNGEIIITTGNINVNGKNFVELKLQDTGNGIPDEIMKNLYKPVTSTKGKAHSGLGLSITRNLVNRIGGSISCRTGETGTIFSVLFPEGT